MGYGEIWKILDDLIIELRKRDETIQPNVIEDFRAAKTMIQVLKVDPSHIENIPPIETYLSNVESYLILMAHQKFGAEFAENWMKKLREARKRISAGENAWKPVSKFVSGLPRNKKWVRVQVSVETPKNRIERLAAECGLSTRMQTDDFVLVYGDDEKLKLFVHRIGEILQRRKGL